MVGSFCKSRLRAAVREGPDCSTGVRIPVRGNPELQIENEGRGRNRARSLIRIEGPFPGESRPGLKLVQSHSSPFLGREKRRKPEIRLELSCSASGLSRDAVLAGPFQVLSRGDFSRFQVRFAVSEDLGLSHSVHLPIPLDVLSWTASRAGWGKPGNSLPGTEVEGRKGQFSGVEETASARVSCMVTKSSRPTISITFLK